MFPLNAPLVVPARVRFEPSCVLPTAPFAMFVEVIVVLAIFAPVIEPSGTVLAIMNNRPRRFVDRARATASRAFHH